MAHNAADINNIQPTNGPQREPYCRAIFTVQHNDRYIYLLKCDLRKKDQNLNIVFISCDWPIPTFFLSVGDKQT